MIDQEFLSTSEYLGDRLSKRLKLLIKRSEDNAGRKADEELASQVLEALEKRGASAPGKGSKRRNLSTRETGGISADIGMGAELD